METYSDFFIFNLLKASTVVYYKVLSLARYLFTFFFCKHQDTLMMMQNENKNFNF